MPAYVFLVYGYLIYIGGLITKKKQNCKTLGTISYPNICIEISQQKSKTDTDIGNRADIITLLAIEHRNTSFFVKLSVN